MFNPFILKKYAALIIPQVLTVVLFAIGSLYYGIVGGLVTFLIGLLLGSLIGNLFLKNPLTAMLEGQGILAFNLDSTGIIQPFIFKVASPYIRGQFQGYNIDDTFDRDSVYQLAPPIVSSVEAQKTSDGLTFTLNQDEFNKAKFSLFHWPVLVYNAQLRSILTKDFLSSEEKSAFAEHSVLYLNRRVEELNSALRDFGRYVVETLKPKASWLQNKWLWIIIVVGLIIMGVIFLPSLISTVGGTISGASSSAAVVPR